MPKLPELEISEGVDKPKTYSFLMFSQHVALGCAKQLYYMNKHARNMFVQVAMG